METKTTPAIGMSVSYGIGSDSYHEIIIDMKRNGRTITTTSAESLLKEVGMDIEQWNALTDEARAEHTIKAWETISNEMIKYLIDCGFSVSSAQQTVMGSYADSYTLRADGSYRSQGSKYGFIRLNSQRAYQSPEF